MIWLGAIVFALILAAVLVVASLVRHEGHGGRHLS
jgi:hypothetical protein